MVFWSTAVLLIAAASGLARLRRIASVGTGYKAKVLGSAIFVSGRDPGSALAEDVSADKYRILRLFRTDIDRQRLEVTASFLGLCGRRAVYRPGLGVTLTRTARAIRLEPSGLPEPAPPPQGLWPEGEPEQPALGPEPVARVLKKTFTEPNPKQLRRTRAVVVARDGQILAERYAPGFGPGMRLCGWSMTKAVMSALVGVLVGEKRLALDRGSLLPQWSGPGDPRAKITLEDLLRMRSGLAFAEVYSDPLSDVTRMLFTAGATADFAAAKPLRAPPGTTWAYASGTTNIISRIEPTVLVTFDTQGGSVHPDHITTHHVVKRVFVTLRETMPNLKRLAFAGLPHEKIADWPRKVFGFKEGAIDAVIPVGDYIEFEMQAIAAHESVRRDVEEHNYDRWMFWENEFYSFFQESFTPPLDDLLAGLM